MMKLFGAVVTAMLLPLGSEAQRHSRDSLVISRIVEGKGLSKAIEIYNPPSGFAVPYDAMYMTIVWNKDTARRTVQLRRPAGASNELFMPGERMALCTYAASKEDDSEGTTCLGGMSLVDRAYEYSVLRFNGNDQLTLDLRLAPGKKPTQVQDVFGDGSGNDHKICGRERAAKNSILTRKTWIRRGSLTGSFDGWCEWDWAPLEPREFQLAGDMWVGAIDRSSFNIRDRRNVAINPENFYLKTPHSKRKRVADMEVNTKRSVEEKYNQWDLQVCIKQEEYLPEMLRECSHFWDVDVVGFDDRGIPVPFAFTLSGKYDADPKNKLVAFLGSVAIAKDSCDRFEKNPLDKFSDYTASYLCKTDEDCQAITESGIVGGPATCQRSFDGEPNFCGAKDTTYGSGKRCDFDAQCASNQVCSFTRGECRSKNSVMKIRAREENVEIPAGATRSILFRVDELVFNTVATGTVINLVSTGDATKIELKYGKNPQDGDIPPGFNVDYDGATAAACNDITSTVGDYYVTTYEAYPLSDDVIVGDWEFTITNTGDDKMVILGAFWALDVQGD